MKDVFISYSSKDKKIVTRLFDSLKNAGMSVWIDEGEILPGDRIREKITQGILESKYLLIILSQNSINSHWVKIELDSAMMREIEGNYVVVIPILVGAIERNEIPIDLRGKAYIDFRNIREFQKSVDKLISSIQRRIDDQYQYEIIYARNEIDILNDTGSVVRHIKKKFFKVLCFELSSLKEEYYSDGSVEVVKVEPGGIVNQVKTLNNLVLTVDLGVTLKRGQQFEQSIETIFHDSFQAEYEYWLTNLSYPIRGTEYIFRFPPTRPYKSFDYTIKRGVQDIPCSATKQEGIENGRKYFLLNFSTLNVHENIKINWHW